MENLSEVLTALITIIISAIVRYLEKRKMEKQVKRKIEELNLFSKSEKNSINEQIKKIFRG